MALQHLVPRHFCTSPINILSCSFEGAWQCKVCRSCVNSHHTLVECPTRTIELPQILDDVSLLQSIALNSSCAYWCRAVFMEQFLAELANGRVTLLHMPKPREPDKGT